MELKEVLYRYGLDPDRPVQGISSGHINHTYLVEYPDGQKALLQKINITVFKKPEWIMSNLKAILKQLNKGHFPYTLFDINLTVNGKEYISTKSGLWRMITFIEGEEATVGPGNHDMAEIVAGGYGHFLKAVNQMEPGMLKVVIPDFHNPEIRFQQLMEAVDSAETEKLKDAQSLTDHAVAFSSIAIEYLKICKGLPLRITHGDAKASNILIDTAEMKVAGVIDLDTVMPGYIMNDFGDMVRSMCNTGKEDDTDTGNVSLDIENFHGISKGFLKTTYQLLHQEELDSLLLGIKSIFYEQFVRFLTDFLNNDVYYHTEYPDHNLDRAKVHLKLLMDFFSKEDQLIKILNSSLRAL